MNYGSCSALQVFLSTCKCLLHYCLVCTQAIAQCYRQQKVLTSLACSKVRGADKLQKGQILSEQACSFADHDSKSSLGPHLPYVYYAASACGPNVHQQERLLSWHVCSNLPGSFEAPTNPSSCDAASRPPMPMNRRLSGASSIFCVTCPDLHASY